MPWKRTSKEEQRLDLVRLMLARKVRVSRLCAEFGVSRQTAYKWVKRYRQSRLVGLSDRSRKPLVLSRQISDLWQRRIRKARQREHTWGALKLWVCLVERFGKRDAPSVATINRWLSRWGLSRKPRRLRRRGPIYRLPSLRIAKCCHEIWTVDFKGWYRTALGTRLEPLTVRDLYSRYGLRIALLRSQTIAETKREFVRIFKRFGLPQCIRCDNGAPFGARGPTGLTRLSVWWIKLGIDVEFITPGQPGQNGSHEQFHRVYKDEVAKRPERTRRAQQVRSDRWLHKYNFIRPHQSLKMKRPAQLFHANKRRYLGVTKPWPYPTNWRRAWVKTNGEISLHGTKRYVGEAFGHEYVGLKPIRNKVWWVYFGPKFIGELRENEIGSIRMARYKRRRSSKT